MEFGITFKGFVSPNRARNLVRQAEEAGFSYCWFYDSHILWRESFVAMAMCMSTLKPCAGPCVLNLISETGHLQRFIWAWHCKVKGVLILVLEGTTIDGLWAKPALLARLAEFTHKVKAMVKGEEPVNYDDCASEVKFPWAVGYDLPVWIAAYGPKALATAGEHGDGLILQLAEPSLVKWFTDQTLEAGKNAGKDMSNFKVQAAAPAYFGDKQECLDKTRWFPAMVGNHVADIVEKYGSDSGLVPKSLTDYIEKRKGYDYSKHGQSDNPYLEFISDDIIESFSVWAVQMIISLKLSSLKKLVSLS